MVRETGEERGVWDIILRVVEWVSWSLEEEGRETHQLGWMRAERDRENVVMVTARAVK